jgi:hypothetical protein
MKNRTTLNSKSRKILKALQLEKHNLQQSKLNSIHQNKKFLVMLLLPRHREMAYLRMRSLNLSKDKTQRRARSKGTGI